MFKNGRLVPFLRTTSPIWRLRKDVLSADIKSGGYLYIENRFGLVEGGEYTILEEGRGKRLRDLQFIAHPVHLLDIREYHLRINSVIRYHTLIDKYIDI